MQTLKGLRKYPIILIFFALLFVVTIIDVAKPAQERSELENRPLEQFPAFSLKALLEAGEDAWTYKYGEFTRDQFLMRDRWVSMASVLDVAQGKLEIGGVWLAKDGYQIAKDSTWSSGQQTRFPLNTAAVAALAEKYPGKVRAMLVPSAASILGDKLRWDPPRIDENALLDQAFAAMEAGGAGVIDLREAFQKSEAAGDPIYYRTDHHWLTDGGAWTAYTVYCAAVDREPVSPSAARIEVTDFYGTHFAKTKYAGKGPDTLVYYDFPNPMSIYKFNTATGGYDVTETGIMDKEKLSAYDKYAAFLHGNNGYSIIRGNGAGSVLVIKDSYGNCFVPYLVESYETIGVVDLRDRPDGVSAIMEEMDYDEILVLYSFTAFTDDQAASRMAR